ncbi:MAG: hypothetical protein ACXWDO_01575 [Bacteroidia bacterium]
MKSWFFLILSLALFQNCGKQKDNDLQIAKDFIGALKVRDTNTIREMLYREDTIKSINWRIVKGASKIIKKYNLPKDTSITKESLPQIPAIKYSFVFFRESNSPYSKKRAIINIYVLKLRGVENKIHSYNVDYEDGSAFEFLKK